MKKLMKLLSISIMLLGILFSVSNFLTANLDAKGIDVGFATKDPVGTTVCLPGGGEDCQGAPLDC